MYLEFLEELSKILKKDQRWDHFLISFFVCAFFFPLSNLRLGERQVGEVESKTEEEVPASLAWFLSS